MTAISYMYVGAYISICISDLSYERMDPLTGSIHKELGKNYCMCSMLSRGDE